MSVKRNDDGNVEFEYKSEYNDKFIRQYRLSTNSLQWWDWDPATFDDEEVGFMWARCGSMEWDALVSHEEGRALLSEAIMALDDPIRWKNVSTHVPPQHRAVQRGNS